MSKPASRQQLIDYCLTKLRAPILEINIDVDQILILQLASSFIRKTLALILHFMAMTFLGALCVYHKVLKFLGLLIVSSKIQD